MADSPPQVVEVPLGQRARLETLKAEFNKIYGRDPQYFARAPGRVNLIGEHIDYCGYAVLPMAIEQDIVIAAATNDKNMLNLSNTRSDFDQYSCRVDDIQIDKVSPRWQHYVLCGYKAIMERFGLDASVGVDVLLDGTVPRSAGLSSSSAVVCCSALAIMHANRKQCSRRELAELCQRCERYIGMEGGGMDQAISMLAEAGTAKLIEFNPVRPTDVILPAGASFVISNTCLEVNKAATSHYNTRVAECRLATQLMAKAKGLDWRGVRKLGDLHDTLGTTLEDMAQLVRDTLHPAPYTKQELCDRLSITADELAQISLNPQTLNMEAFQLYDRALHVYTEANRVHQFKRVCDAGGEDALTELGDLMNASHASCRDQYQCSCPELDQLTQMAMESGALGSRLTGAGWGGCAVSLVPSDKVATFLQQMYDKFYKDIEHRRLRHKESLFATQPGGGACIYVL